MEKVYFRKYSESFRKMVVAEYEAGASIGSLRRRYGIGSRNTLLKWVRRYATAGLRHEVVVIQRAEEKQQVNRPHKPWLDHGLYLRVYRQRYNVIHVQRRANS